MGCYMAYQTKKTSVEILDKDERLQQIFRSGFQSIKCVRLFTLIHQDCQVPIRIRTENPEIQTLDMVIFSKNKPLHASMDAIACLWNGTWSLTPKKEYLFDIDPLWEGKIYNADQAQADFGEAFINAIDDLPASLKDKLYKPFAPGDNPKNAGVSMDQLPNAMYQQLLGIANIDHDHAVANARPGTHSISPSNVPKNQFRAWVSTDPKRGFNTYTITMHSPEFASSMTISDVKKREKENADAKSAGKEQTVYRTQKNEVSAQDATHVSELKQIVEIHLAGAYLPDVLKYLAETYGISLVGHNRSLLPQRCNVDIPKMPLHQALDRLTRLYKDTEWEWRKRGMLVVRKKKLF
jgi:hypothetical protein